MNSLRPLVTITILVVVGAFLYVKINQGPVRPVPGANDAWPNQPPDGVPPLAASGTAPAADSSSAPAWPTADMTPSADAPTPTPESSALQPLADTSAAVAEGGSQATPAVPAIPELLEMSTPPSAAPETASIPLPAGLPANIPTARYPDQPATNGIADGSDVAESAVPQTASTPATREPVSPPLATQENSQPTEPAEEVDRYAASAYTTNPYVPDAAITPVEPTFAASWPAIQQALERGELARAQQLLSHWYAHPSLTPTDAERVESLLSQLAGTVVYSTDHHLEPPYVAKPGETLETIAKEYNVPWQLLAKINGIPAAGALQPGQELKVVRGPFSAVVDLDRKELVLMLDDRYAGRFAISPPTGASLSEGEWYVQGKPAPARANISRHILLASVETASAGAGHLSVIGSSPSVEPDFTQIGADGQVTKGAMPYLAVSPADAEEVADILSVGSRVVIRR